MSEAFAAGFWTDVRDVSAEAIPEPADEVSQLHRPRSSERVRQSCWESCSASGACSTLVNLSERVIEFAAL